jgi:nitrogen-specific signal transduction histidine kinase/ActR/RegA family two-component response regulator
MRKDKTVFFADINATPSKIGKKTCMIGLFRDITERIQMEERARQSQKIEAIGTLAGGIAHDFNNILSPIIGYTDLVMDSLPGGSEEASMLNEVKKASYRAKDLVQQILAFSRKSTQEKKPFIIQPIIKEAGKLLRSSIPSSIEIRQDIENNCGPVMCDPTQIHQIVMNLCTNAYHAMLQDGGILEISLSRIIVQREDPLATEGLAAGTYIRLIVSDTGHGMDKKTLTRIFEPYFTTKEKGEGTGLGLSLVQRIVEDHNGKINVYSNRGEGTTFTIYLPEVVLKAKDMGKGKKETLPRGTEHILLVDDEREIVAMLTRILEKLGYQVTGLTDSIEALECFKANPDQIDLVITDQTMPHMAGSELAKRMLEIKPGFPIILCTGFSSIISEKKAINIGIKKMLMKPVIRSELAKVIRSVLDDSDQKR